MRAANRPWLLSCRVYVSDKSSYEELGKDNPTGGKRWIDGTWPIGAAMTLKAYDELEKVKQKEKGEGLDGSVKLTNRVSRRLSRVTAGVSIVALIVSIVAIFKDNIWPTEKSSTKIARDKCYTSK